MENNKKIISTQEAAKLLGISRIAVFKKIKTGKIRGIKIGRNYAIPKKDYPVIVGKSLTLKQKKVIDAGIKKTVREYGKTLKLLGTQ